MSDNSVCDPNDDTCIYIYTATCVVVIALFMAFAYYRPIVSTQTGQQKKIESVLLAFLFLPVYAAIYGYQNPMSEGSELLTAIISFLFPLIVLCLDHRGAKVSVPITGDSV